MMDRRSLLKRVGMAGLAIPAALAVESRLVLPPEDRAALAAARAPMGYAFPGQFMVRAFQATHHVDDITPLGAIAREYRHAGYSTVRLELEGLFADNMAGLVRAAGGEDGWWTEGVPVRVIPWWPDEVVTVDRERGITVNVRGRVDRDRVVAAVNRALGRP